MVLILRRDRDAREKVLDDEPDRISCDCGADGDHKEFHSRKQRRLAGKTAFEHADAEKRDPAE